MERNKLIRGKNYSTEQLNKESMKGEFIKLRDFIAARGTILHVGLLIHYLIYGHLTIKFREFSRPDFYNNSG